MGIKCLGNVGISDTGKKSISNNSNHNFSLSVIPSTMLPGSWNFSWETQELCLSPKINYLFTWNFTQSMSALLTANQKCHHNCICRLAIISVH